MNETVAGSTIEPFYAQNFKPIEHLKNKKNNNKKKLLYNYTILLNVTR